jgi:spore coat polysaccharide biosynthesis protein SpsF
MNCGAVILARMDSKRFPEKATKLLRGKRLIEWCIDGAVGEGYSTVLATSDTDHDDPLAEIARGKGIPCFRGPLENVAKRVLMCIREHKLDFFARVNADSPFVRNELIGEAFKLAVKQDMEFVTNLVPRAFPYGISVEVLKSSVFERCYNDLNTDRYREHVTSYFYDNIGRFRTQFIPYQGNDQDVRLVVDTPEDLDRIERMISFAKADISRLAIADLVRLYRESRSR